MNVTPYAYAEALAYAERMVRLWFRSQSQGTFDREDALQEARIAVWNAAHRYDAATGVPFRLYARQQALGYARNALRQWRGHGQAQNVPEVDENLCPRAADHAPGIIAAGIWEQVAALDPLHAALLTLRYREEQSVPEVAAALGCHPKGLCRIERRAVAQLRGMMR